VGLWPGALEYLEIYGNRNPMRFTANLTSKSRLVVVVTAFSGI